MDLSSSLFKNLDVNDIKVPLDVSVPFSSITINRLNNDSDHFKSEPDFVYLEYI